ncbi:MAG: stage II sporulation protein R [Ruminococcus sp.]|jgi:stage II sporulation protein R|nr:stage II sporulation protein R [Ruminococcus sp.]
MKTKSFILIEAAAVIGIILTILITVITSFADDYKSITDNVLRLHILANSDSDSDQELKLKVRDEILKETSSIFEASADINAAKAAAAAALPEIERIAKETVIANGYDYPVYAELTKMQFDTRVYGDITMPAGEYDAIRITIGEAEGKNWWCVMFPPLCIPAVIADEPIEVFNGVLDESEEDILTNPQKYEARFFILDLINDIKSE